MGINILASSNVVVYFIIYFWTSEQNDKHPCQRQKERNHNYKTTKLHIYSNIYADNVTQMTQYSKDNYDMTILHLSVNLV